MIPPVGGRNEATAHLAAELGDYVEAKHMGHVEPMAEAILGFLALEGLQEPFPADLIALASARCLFKFNMRDAALDFLDDHVADRALLPIYTELLHTDPFNYRQWRLVAAGVLCRDEANPTATRSSYTLHVERVPMEEGDLDLGVYMTIKHLLELFSGLWESRSGDFQLGIKGLPRKKGRAKDLPTAKEIVAYCRSWFDRLGTAKAWVDSPEITVRDLTVL